MHQPLRPSSLVARLLLGLALLVFGAAQVDAAGWSSATSPTAVNETARHAALLTEQTHQLRAPLPLDDLPEGDLPAQSGPKPSTAYTTTAFSVRATPCAALALDILPPVRGPPAV